MSEDKPLITGLDLLRAPFPAHQISQLPKPTAAQTKAVKDNFKTGVRCEICGGWHHPKVIHLDYVGHAALTDRLLDADPEWNWEPMAFGENGLPIIIGNEFWIRLTVCGITRPGFGDAQGKTGPNATKEMIGDALRNAGMRFGMALDLWHNGDLHIDDDVTVKVIETKKTGACKKDGSRNKDWKGPMSKDHLFNAYKSFVTSFEDSDSVDNCTEIYESEDFKIFRTQADEDWADLISGWKGPENSFNVGIKQAYQGRMRELEQLSQAQ